MNIKHSAVAVFFLVGASLTDLRGQFITDFTPKYGSPGEQVNIYGSAFYYPAGNPVVQVRFGSTSAAFGITTDSQIVATVPSGAASGQISVRKSTGDWVYHATPFTVIGPGPYIAGFTPTEGNVGTVVYIDGAHFSNPLAVYFNGTNAPGAAATSATRIQVNVPSTVTTGPITVQTSLGYHTSTANFYVPPVILGFSPTNGRAATNVVLSGRNFIGTTAVYFNNLQAGFSTPTNNNILVATVPPGATTGKIRIVTTPTLSYETTSNFVVNPTLSSYSPAFGTVGTAVTLFGANLHVGTPTVRFGGVPASIVTNKSFGQLTAVVPNGATNAPITVTTADGSATSVATFYLPPSITGFTPTNSAAGTPVTITGQNLLGTSFLNFNNMPASFTPPTNNTTLYAVVPLGFDTGPLILNTPGGTTNSGSKLFYAPPEISMLSPFTPTHGLPGTNVVIFGKNFLGATAVRFGGLTAAFSPPTNNTILVATVPANATNAPITVVAPAGSSTSAADFTLDYTADLIVGATDVPDPVFVGSNLVYSISVQNKGPFTAPNVVLTNILPSSAILKDVTSTQGTVNKTGNPVTANIGTLFKGASVTVTLTLAPQAAGWITNFAAASSSYPDPSMADATATTSTFVQPLPLLSIRRPQPDRVCVSWPVALSNFTLQYLPSFSATNFWSNVTTTVNPVGDENVVTETNAPPARFYRLRQ